MTYFEIRKDTLEKAGGWLGGTATDLRGALDELRGAIAEAGPIPQNDDVSAMIAAACQTIHEIAMGSVESAVTELGGHGELLTKMAATYEEADLAGASWV
ncbi:PE domain-containing protein [Nonomuraea sediminis]|uniref:PE domain-containing protein n=1 Tax=Nonomuraea sediminis TaxID=2835864 RepID=UPI001BDD71D6|nr:PE domain-containing protein [Nonomuraea sediminis]